jgi:hypothetical protein
MFYEIHPIRATSTLTRAITTTNGSVKVTINFAADYGLNIGDVILCDRSYRFAC